MRAVWSGMISFGLVNIPIKLFNATKEEKISFHQMHKDDSGRVQYKKACKVCGNELQNEDIVKGYEYKKGQYVVVSDEELDRINLKTTKTIDILGFVDGSEIDDLQYEKAYYIAPDENGERAYALLRQTLKETGKVGIGKIAFRNREELAALREKEDRLVLETLHYADEMVRPDDLGIPAENVQAPASELELAKVLVNHMTTTFDPAAYHDEYEDALRDLINKKIEGEEVTAPAAPQPTNVIDIISALKASLAQAEEEREPEEIRKSA